MLEAGTGAGWEAEERFPAAHWQPVQAAWESEMPMKEAGVKGNPG